jgi:cell division septum initiation protein DivIVA
MEPNDASSSSARAHELRASLGARREVEALLAEASATREAAVADADAVIEEAQQVSDQLLRESREEAERVTTDARLRAEGVVSRARTEAEDITRQARAAADAVRARAEAQVEEYRRRVRAELLEQVTREVTEQSRRELARVHERQQATIGDLEASVRILGVSMEAAVGNIAEMLGSLDSLRAHTAESLGDAGLSIAAQPRQSEPLDHLFRPTTPAAGEAVEVDQVGAETGPDTGSSIFDNPRPGSVVPASGSVYDVSAESSVDAAETGPEAPRSATEAFLLSAHLDHGDPPLPPMDDADVGARYARDAMRATARARTRQEDSLEVEPDRSVAQAPESSGEPPPSHQEDASDDEGETSGKPLGWLFRS